MYFQGAFVICLIFITHNAETIPLGYQGNNINCFNPQILPESIGSTPVITEIIPALQFGDITVTGDLPVGGSIRVKGCFPVYGTVAIDGGLPSAGTAIVNTGGGVVAQIL